MRLFLIKVMHARSGGNIEVMGLMQGKVHGDTMIIMDAFGLPVEGTETRVNAQNEAYEYMVSYMEQAKEVRRKWQDTKINIDIVLGWTSGKCNWMVPFSSWLWMLALRYWCQHTNAQSTIPRTMGSCGGKSIAHTTRDFSTSLYIDRSQSNNVSRQSGYWCISNVSQSKAWWLYCLKVSYDHDRIIKHLMRDHHNTRPSH